MIDVFPLHRRKSIDPLALNPFGCLHQPLPPIFCVLKLIDIVLQNLMILSRIEDSIYQNMLPATGSLLEHTPKLVAAFLHSLLGSGRSYDGEVLGLLADAT
ncbi:hypothetical protein L1887_34719 [Cichorium endivia]|nr:hypothetical protein L1887_34719 [Cichorium endivia]